MEIPEEAKRKDFFSALKSRGARLDQLMITKRVACLLLLLTVVEQIVISSCSAWFLHNEETGPLVDDKRQYAKPGITVAEMIEARGYMAKEFRFITQDGYYLTVTRGTNPLINEGKRGLDNKLPILFLNPATASCNVFVLNSVGVRPKVYDTKRVNMAKLTTAKLAKMTKGDPSVRSLPFLAMNFGHEVWLLDRRGFGQSRGKVSHEKRTIDDALNSVPTSLLGNAVDGFSLSDGLEDRRPLRGNEVEASEESSEIGKRLGGQAKSLTNSTSSASLFGESQRSATTTRQSGSSASDFLQIISILANFKSKLTGIGHDKALNDVKRSFIDTFDPDYWRFSLDENAEFDFPEAIDLVLNKTGQTKLHTVGMSAGGAVILLGLAAKPDLANKIAKAVLWSPSVNLGSKSDIVFMLGEIFPLVQGYVGPVPMLFMTPVIEKAFVILCSNEFMQRTICENMVDATFGFSGGQMPIKPFIAGNAFRPTSVFELTQLAQFARTETPCKLQFNSEEENINKYGQEKAPCYDLGNIKLQNMSFYVGNTDTLVSPDDVRTTISQLSVPAEMNLVSKPGLFFDHLGYFAHKDLDKLAVLPSLLDIERSEL